MPTQHSKELTVALLSVVEQVKLCGAVCELQRVNVELAVDLALFVSEAEEEFGAQLAIELERPSEAVRDMQRCERDVGESCGTTYDGRAIGLVGSDGLRGEFIEDRKIDGDLVEEDAEAAANGCAIVASRREDEADAWGGVDDVAGEAVVVEAQAEIDR